MIIVNQYIFVFEIQIWKSTVQFLVNRVVPVGNGYLLLNLRNAIKNQRRNSIQMTPTRTKLAKPKTAFTMVILAAFYILLTHICSDYSLLPSCQSRRSNAFSLCHEPPFAGRQKSDFLNTGCWHTTHIISTTFTVNHLRNRHRNHVRFKSTMPTSLNCLVPSVLVKSGNVLPPAANGSDEDIDFDEFVTAQTFAPPGSRPVRSGKALTKTQAAAARKAEKEAKWKEAEGKKSAAVARRVDAKNKKQEKLITAAETKAQKAVAKAEDLKSKLDDAKKLMEGKSPAPVSGGVQSNKKIRGEAGKSTPTSTTARASLVDSPQRKSFSAKKRVNIHSPYRHRSLALSTGGSSESFSSSASGSKGKRGSWEVETSDASSSEVEVVTLVAPPHILGASTLKRGGRRSVSPKGRVPMKTKVSTFTLAKFDSDSSMDTDGGSEEEGRGGHEDGRSTTRMKPSISSVFDKFDREEKDIIKGIFPGNYDQSLTSRFVAYHFAGVREDYYPFSRWAEAQALTNPASPILIATWKAQNMLRGGRAQRGDGESTADDDGDFGELDSKEGNKTDDDDYRVADSKVCNKTRVNESFNSPLSQAPKRLFQREEQVTSLTGVSSRKIGQRDIRELFPLAQGPVRGQASSPQDQGGMSRESREQLGKLKDDASYGPVRRGKEITWSGSTNSYLAEQTAWRQIMISVRHPPTVARDTGKFPQQKCLR